MTKYRCPVCGLVYVHKKRLIGHLKRTNCGEVAGKLGLKLDLNGRSTKGLKKFENKTVEESAQPETEEALTVEVSEPATVEETVQETDPGPDKDDGEELPEGVRKRKDGKHEIQCPGGCNHWLCIEDQPAKCPKCGGELEWN